MEYLLLLPLFVGFVKPDSLSCYSCSYQTSGDPTITYECANAPMNTSSGPVSSCQKCYTKATYEQDMKTVRSVSRSCFVQGICSGDKCCDRNGPYVSCEHKCNSEMCNGENVEGWPDTFTSGSPGTMYCETMFLLSLFLILFLQTI